MPVNLALVDARRRARLSQDGLARKVRDAGRRLGAQNGCSRNTVGRWEAGEAIPQPAMLAALEEALGVPAESLGFGEAPAGWLAPPAFPADVLSGHWVTCYQFPHEGKQLCHADLAAVTASGQHVRAANALAARTEGRAVPFLNEVEAELASRHLVGHWRNTSDTRYFGMVHLAVLPGESVLDGYFTGFASDVAVSLGRWKWVRLSLADEVPEISLKDPAVLYKVIMTHSQYDAPLTLADIGGET